MILTASASDRNPSNQLDSGALVTSRGIGCVGFFNLRGPTTNVSAHLLQGPSSVMSWSHLFPFDRRFRDFQLAPAATDLIFLDDQPG